MAENRGDGMTIEDLSEELRKAKARCFEYCGTWNAEIIKEILSRPDGQISYETRAKAEAFIKE